MRCKGVMEVSEGVIGNNTKQALRPPRESPFLRIPVIPIICCWKKKSKCQQDRRRQRIQTENFQQTRTILKANKNLKGQRATAPKKVLEEVITLRKTSNTAHPGLHCFQIMQISGACSSGTPTPWQLHAPHTIHCAAGSTAGWMEN